MRRRPSLALLDATVGVDIGATTLRVAIGDSRGRILARTSSPTTKKATSEALADQVACAISELLEKSGTSRPGRIGIATTGPLDRRGGIVNPANLPKVGFVPLVDPLLEEFGREVVLTNDCVAAAIAEKELGLGRGFDNFVYVTLSTGIGAGVFVDGHLLLGKDGNAHEVGHIVLDPAGRLRCGCGKPGHWEAYCSGRNIPRLAPVILGEGEAERVSALSSTDIFKLAAKGDPGCAKVVQEVGRLNAAGFASIVDVYDPELIVVGGSVALNNPRQVLGPIEDLTEDYARNRVPPVRMTELGEDAVLKGALLAALHSASYPELGPWTFMKAAGRKKRKSRV